MNDELVREHMEVTGELLTTADAVRKQRKQTSRLTAFAAAMASLAVLVSMAVVFMVIKERNSSARTNGQRIDALTRELGETRQDVNQEDVARRDQLECQGQFDLQIRRVALEYLASIGELVVVLSTVPPTDPDRQRQINDRVDDLNERLVQYRTSIVLLEAWRDDVPPTACPL